MQTKYSFILRFLIFVFISVRYTFFVLFYISIIFFVSLLPISLSFCYRVFKFSNHL
nr:MAG TPA: hypothetical protein [Caudoviricetes sp.]